MSHLFQKKIFRPHRDDKLLKPRKKQLRNKSKRLLWGKTGIKSTSRKVYLVWGLVQPPLSRPACEALGLMFGVNTVTETGMDFRAATPDVFKGVGKLKEPHHIELEPSGSQGSSGWPSSTHLELWSQAAVLLLHHYPHSREEPGRRWCRLWGSAGWPGHRRSSSAWERGRGGCGLCGIPSPSWRRSSWIVYKDQETLWVGLARKI